ncbi:MAG: translation initiation factor IF-3 [Victivallales bacterium]|nr:translation initiation factor IF-3 [Victivallales bacterium]
MLKKDKPIIKNKEVRLISNDGEQLGVVPIGEAFKKSENAGLDLVLVAEKAKPPVCKIMDFGKLVYEQKQKKKNQKKTQSVQKTKEIKFHVNTDDHDYNIKIDHAIKFLEKGYKVKISLFFRGREAAHKEIGFDLINKTVEKLSEYGKADKAPALSGRIISVLLNPL